ncbi:hypothetical protein BDN70DRAFT_886013 [Pholiota conissans]|uniref:Uncharacterized protein n=1 Tax=Pholiota conissans TaxID=109636 RepID=A0A9P5YT52_9AGAR|nr:hypothetical protein BDN70DRAFT_886013 [Pholiota conissans]
MNAIEWRHRSRFTYPPPTSAAPPLLLLAGHGGWVFSLRYESRSIDTPLRSSSVLSPPSSPSLLASPLLSHIAPPLLTAVPLRPKPHAKAQRRLNMESFVALRDLLRHYLQGRSDRALLLSSSFLVAELGLGLGLGVESKD